MIYRIRMNASVSSCRCLLQEERRTGKRKVVPFDLVDEEQAYKEGEGNRSLDYWRKVHNEFFTEDYANSGMEFDYNYPLQKKHRGKRNIIRY